MADNFYKLLEQECKAWKRSLDLMEEKNIAAKTTIATILNNQVGESLPEDLETFQTAFIKKDSMISLLRNDIMDLQQLLASSIHHNAMPVRSLRQKTLQIRHNMGVAEEEFHLVQNAFYHYLAAHT